MSLRSILDEKSNLIKLEKAYIKDRMSTTEISRNSVDLFGGKIGSVSVYNALVRNKIPVRNKSDSVSIATSTLDINKTFLKETTIEWIDGFLLGDGSINFKHNEKRLGSRFTIGSSQKEWAEYSMSGLKNYSPIIPNSYGKIRKKAPNPIWSSRTLTHPDIVAQSKRWYPLSNGFKKKIPNDVRITPISVLLWYLGDGSITKYGVSYVVRLATCSFDPIDIDNLLIPKLNAIGIEAIRTKEKNDIKITTQSLNDFFDFIGKKSPIDCYNYKFEYAPWLSLYRISDVAINDREKWRIQYMYKMGKLDCQKSPGDKIILFNDEQKNKLRKMLDEHNSHDEYANISISDSGELVHFSSIINNDIERWNARYMITRGLVVCEKKSMFTKEQAKELRDKLNLYGDKSAIPQHLIDYEFLKYRQNGFPYYLYSDEELLKKINSLKNYSPAAENGPFKWDGFGTELANYFHPHMFECRKKGKMSPIEFFNSDSDFKRGIFKIISLYPKITEARIREICCNETASSRINNFPPRVMLTVLRHLYDGKRITVLDPCSGFSGRLLGCYASGIVKKYIGVDLSRKTYDGLIKTKEWIGGFSNGFESDIRFGNCLDILPTIKEDIDFVFTSPPFLDEEEYIGVSVENNYDAWKKIFIDPFIRKVYGALRTGGLFSVYTETIRRNDFPFDFCNIAKEVGFKKLDDIKFKMPSRENLRKNSTHRIVKVMVFEK